MSYQEEAYKFAKYKNKEYPFLALGEEAGEVLGKLAKYVRKNNVSIGEAIDNTLDVDCVDGEKLLVDLAYELGDVLWQVNACCTELKLDVRMIEDINLAKLRGRDRRNTIIGSGDNR
tara:strand:- start:45 stop:395 length:351 start_codon:yes stop_codon:yes gene_type:complete